MAVLAAISLTLVSSAWALDGNVEATLGRNVHKSENFKRVGSSFAFGYENPFSAQLDLSLSKFQSTTIYDNVTLHGVYDLPNQWTLGAFGGNESRRTGGRFTRLGLEAAYSGDTLHGEIYAGGERNEFNTMDGAFYGLDLSYNPDGGPVALLGGYHGDTTTGKHRWQANVGFSYTFDNAIALRTRFGTDAHGNRLGLLTLDYTFGRGTHFERRDYYKGFFAD